MRVGILVANLEPYGAEYAAFRLACGLKEKGLDVRLYVADACPTLQSESIPTVVLREGRPLGLLQEFLYAPIQLLRLNRLLKRHQLDVMISFMERMNILNLYSKGSHKRVLSIRTYLSRNLAESGLLRSLPTQILYRLAMGRADHVIGVSRAAAADFSRIFGVASDRIGAMVNGYNLKQISEQAREPLTAEEASWFDGPTAIHIGRFDKHKGQWYLIRAFKKVLEKRSDAKLLLLGSGQLEDQMKVLVRQVGIEASGVFAGHQINPFKFVSRSDVFAFPSILEGYPNALVEALICKVPSISADCLSGPAELLEPERDPFEQTDDLLVGRYGLLVPPFDGAIKSVDDPMTRSELMLADGIVRLLTDESLRGLYQERAEERIQEFGLERVAERWVTWLGNFCSCGTGPGGQACRGGIENAGVNGSSIC